MVLRCRAPSAQAALTACKKLAQRHLPQLSAMVEGAGLIDDGRAAWVDRDFKAAKLEIVFLDQHQTLTEDGTITFCQGATVSFDADDYTMHRSDGTVCCQGLQFGCCSLSSDQMAMQARRRSFRCAMTSAGMSHDHQVRFRIVTWSLCCAAGLVIKHTRHDDGNTT